ncbi:MAG: ATP-binding cassette domain-containing protein [Pseudomonadales bacterium]
MQYSLTLEDVSKSFGTNIAVNHISAAIPEGHIYGFLGPNGAGKTTTIRMIMSILYPDAGRITVLGGSPERAKDRLGYLPEEKGLYKKMKTAELVSYFGRLKGMKRQVSKDRAKQLLTQFGLGHCIDVRCDALSKGMGQKVQIISTLMHDPELVILDEPFSGLDPINVETVRTVILDLKRAGRTVIFSTHVMEQAEQICDSILLINQGHKVLDGTIEQVKKEGHQTIRLDYEGRPSAMAALPGIVRVNDMGKRAELSLAPDADARAILKRLVSEMNIRTFSINEPSLHEIFVRTVGESPE